MAYTGDITVAETLVKPYQTGQYHIRNMHEIRSSRDHLAPPLEKGVGGDFINLKLINLFHARYLVTDIKAFFYADNFLVVQPHDAKTFELCAQIRAKKGLKFADALHYATALKAGCQFFITNDAGIKSKDQNMEVLLIKDFIHG